MSARKADTRPVTQEQAASHFNKAKEFHETMLEAFGRGRWNSAALAGVHCAIAAADAVLGRAVGFRSAGESHSQAALLIGIHVRSPDAQRQAQRLLRILEKKSAVAYESREFNPLEAGELIKDVGRFFEWARGFFS